MALVFIFLEIWSSLWPNLPAIIGALVSGGILGGVGVNRWNRRFQRDDVFLERINSLTEKLGTSYIDKFKEEAARAKADNLVQTLRDENELLRTQIENLKTDPDVGK